MRTKQWVGGALVVTFVTLSLWIPGSAKGGVEEAISYLEGKPANPWATMALAAAGRNPSVEYLKNITGGSALALEAPILALAAAGKDPRTFPNTNLISALKGFVQNNQIGDLALINDDIFGILALVASGEAASSPAVQGSVKFLIANQNEDGGWSYGVGGGGDTNTTAAGIMALRAAGKTSADTAIIKALSFLRGAQNNDGGFPYDPKSPYGTSSDASSDAWVLSALSAAGESMVSWSKNGKTPLGHLSSLQKETGYFVNQEGGSETSFTPTETSYALIALLGKWYPVRTISFEKPLAHYRIEGKNQTVCEGEIRAENALTLVEAASATCGFTYAIKATSYGPYLERINADGAEGTKGWLYAVNLNLPDVGAADYAIREGDDVLWSFGEWPLKLTRLLVSKKEIAKGESIEAFVESFWSGGWTPLEGALVRVGSTEYETGSAGKTTLVPPEGVTKIFAEKEGYVRTEKEEVIVGEKKETVIPLEITIDAEGGPPASGGGGGGGVVPEVSFVISGTSGSAPAFSFGSVKTGDVLEKIIVLKNDGRRPLHIESVVRGNALFRENLKVDGKEWRAFETELLSGQERESKVEVKIPSTYKERGKKSGTLTFWGIAE